MEIIIPRYSIALSSKLAILPTVLFTKLLANYSAVSLVVQIKTKDKRLAKWLDSLIPPPSLQTLLLGFNQCHLVTDSDTLHTATASTWIVLDFLPVAIKRDCSTNTKSGNVTNKPSHELKSGNVTDKPSQNELKSRNVTDKPSQNELKSWNVTNKLSHELKSWNVTDKPSQNELKSWNVTDKPSHELKSGNVTNKPSHELKSGNVTNKPSHEL